jgi:hypothetical protein
MRCDGQGGRTVEACHQHAERIPDRTIGRRSWQRPSAIERPGNAKDIGRHFGNIDRLYAFSRVDIGDMAKVPFLGLASFLSLDLGDTAPGAGRFPIALGELMAEGVHYRISPTARATVPTIGGWPTATVLFSRRFA